MKNDYDYAWWEKRELNFYNRADRRMRCRTNSKQHKLEQKLTKIKTRKKNKLARKARKRNK